MIQNSTFYLPKKKGCANFSHVLIRLWKYTLGVRIGGNFANVVRVPLQQLCSKDILFYEDLSKPVKNTLEDFQQTRSSAEMTALRAVYVEN